MELSTQTSTESKRGNESEKGIAGEKMQCPSDNLLLTYSKRKRKKKGQTSSTHEENIRISPENASSSQIEHPVKKNTAKPPTGVKKNVPSKDQSLPTLEQENSPKIPGKSVRKGRNAKKKALAAAAAGAAVLVGELKNQVPQGVPVIKSPRARSSPKWTSPKQGMTGIPTGLQPMNFIRNSSSPAVQSPKQEKFSPYWSTKEVETGLASGLLISGIIRINPRNYQKSYISPGNDDDGKDVLIDGIIDRNRALEGDEVTVKLYDESKWQVEENSLGEPVVQKTGMVVSILAKNHNRRTVGYLKLVHKAKSTPKKSGKGDGRENNIVPGECSSHLQRELFPSPCAIKEANSVPCTSANHNSATSLPATDKNTNVISNMRTCEQLEQGLIQRHDNNQVINLKPEDRNVFASHVMQMETYQYPQQMESSLAQSYPNASGNSVNIPPFVGSSGQTSSYAESTDKIHPFGGEEQRLPFTQPSNQRLQSPQQMPLSQPKNSPIEVFESPAEAKREPFKMPERVLFSPRDARMPRMWVKTSSLPSGTPVDLNPSNCQNHLFLACIQEWNELPIAIGNLLTYVGEADEVDSETTALLLEHDLDVTPYPEDIFTLPALPFQIPQKELDERLDLRKMCIFTIDPATAKDLDDALSVREIGDGLLEVGVHIADPTFFLEEDSPLDLCVRQRATSIYLVQNVFHMLPKDLCMLCSLLPGEDKLAFSLLMEVDSRSWKIVSHKFSRSIVNSCAQLSYEHAQAFMDDPNHDWSSAEDFPTVQNGYTLNDLCRCVNMLRPFSAVLRERRFTYKSKDDYDDEEENGIGGGALKINQPKLCFKLDYATLMPQDVFIYENKESHRLIEELMLTANILTAQRLASMFPEHAFLRRHSRPKMKLLTDLAQELTHYGIHLDISAAGALNESLKQYGPSDTENLSNSVNLCDNPDDDSAHIMMADYEKQANSDKTVPISNEGLSEQNRRQEPVDEMEVSVSLENLLVEPQADFSSVIEDVPSSVRSVTAIEESFSVLKIKGDTVKSEALSAMYVETPNLGENNVLDSEIQSITKTPSDEKGVLNLDVSKDQRKKCPKQNNLSSLLMRNSQSDEELAIARGLVLNHLCAKPMVRADYYCLGASVEKTANKDSKWKIEGDPSRDGGEVKVYTHHYALNVPLYTHFTSPIRRYADIMVHRLLAASLGYAPIPEANPLDFQKIATNCNKQNMGAKRASEASNELFFRLWIQLQVEQEDLKAKEGRRALALLQNQKNGDSDENRSEGGIREVAVVVNAKDYAFHAILLRFGVLVRVYVNKLPATARSYKKHGTSTISIRWHLPGKNTVTRDSPKQDITMFSLVDLAIYYSYSARRIRAELLSPFANSNNDS